MSKYGFEPPATASNTPDGWRLDAQGRRVPDDESAAKTQRVADALARVADNELTKEARDEPH